MEQIVGSAVVPVRDGEGTEINVVRERCGAVDDDGSCDTVGVLGGVMGVVPGSPVLLGQERIRLSPAFGGDWAFCHAVGAVVDGIIELADSMPVEGGSGYRQTCLSKLRKGKLTRYVPIPVEVINDGDLDPVAPICAKLVRNIAIKQVLY